MAKSRDDILHGRDAPAKDERFPFAPEGWSTEAAERIAAEEGIQLGDDHWEAIRGVQEYFAKNEVPRVRELHDALGERFHAQGGMKYLYLLFPAGPVAQGCRLAGLQAPAGSTDKSFGSVQ